MSKRKKAKRVTPARSVKSGRGRIIAVIALMAMLSVTGLLVAHRASLWGATPTVAPQSTPSLAKEYIYAGGKLIATEEPPGAPSCSFSINPISQSFASSGGTGSVGVTITAGTGCNWTATSNASWINITSGSSGTGNGTVNYSVASNSGAARTGTMTIAGQTFTVNQDAAGGSCVTAITPTSRTFTSFGGNSTVTVTASGCTWTAVSNASWITITTSMPVTGSIKVRYNVASNSGTCRVGTITIGSFTHTITQSGSAGSCP